MNTKTQDNDQVVAQKLFGATKKLQCTGGYKPNQDQLTELATIPDTVLGVINLYCTGCGSIVHLNKEGGEALAQRGNISFPDSWKDKYLKVEQCLVCGDEFKNPELVTL